MAAAQIQGAIEKQEEMASTLPDGPQKQAIEKSIEHMTASLKRLGVDPDEAASPSAAGNAATALHDFNGVEEDGKKC